MLMHVLFRQIQLASVVVVCVLLMDWIYSRPWCFLDFSFGDLCVIDSIALTGLMTAGFTCFAMVLNLFGLYFTRRLRGGGENG